MKALIAAPSEATKIRLADVPDPTPTPSQAVVTVRTVSLNRGEIRALAYADEGSRLGWDLSGVIEQAATDGSGPAVGTRVVGLVTGGAWSTHVAVPTTHLAPLPDNITFATASTLPISGLTALRALSKGGLLYSKRVLITGAAGGLGRWAIQLASQAGADVTCVVGRPERTQGLRELGASQILINPTLATGLERKYDLILESVGGRSLATSLASVAPLGTVVSLGNSSDETVSFNAPNFYRQAGATLYGFIIFSELERFPSAARDLTWLMTQLVAGRLQSNIAFEASWHEPAEAFERLMSRSLAGKAVLHIEP
ncbi:zinc-binding dehydrogenase [Leptolyngbya sp. FACHB-261]|uniref:zinc-binding dehydrogenase n=1 Tax=Leptolyngbya sp. FACHB-261 TaxID=2692806 RepID=UPI0016867D93|nr:zinc-binding dehydrogenase [Leptolyngbya sp. FACHB-261]MBD2102894.1 zinc-binding dehydrogenase [Leptolyngbya sp. FACHB-261]